MSLGDAVLVLLWVRDMAHFASLNAVYSRHFPAVRPAARACVQVALPAAMPLILQVRIAAPGAPQSLYNKHHPPFHHRC